MLYTFTDLTAISKLPKTTQLELVKDEGIYLYAKKRNGTIVVSYGADISPIKSFNLGDDFVEHIGVVGDYFVKGRQTRKIIINVTETMVDVTAESVAI